MKPLLDILEEETSVRGGTGSEMENAARVGGYHEGFSAPDGKVRRLWQEDGDRRLCSIDQWPWEDAEDQGASNHQDKRCG
jgi:hypothetical protein